MRQILKYIFLFKDLFFGSLFGAEKEARGDIF